MRKMVLNFLQNRPTGSIHHEINKYAPEKIFHIIYSPVNYVPDAYARAGNCCTSAGREYP
jgi:hypothetical protein